MVRRLLLAAAVVVGAALATAPSDAEARRWHRGRAFYRGPARVSVGYAPRYHRGFYGPRYGYWGGPRYGYWGGYRGGVYVGRGGVWVGW